MPAEPTVSQSSYPGADVVKRNSCLREKKKEKQRGCRKLDGRVALRGWRRVALCHICILIFHVFNGSHLIGRFMSASRIEETHILFLQVIFFLGCEVSTESSSMFCSADDTCTCIRQRGM